MPTENGFSFDALVNRLRIGSARFALEVRDSRAFYIVFDMLANSGNLLGSPFRLRRKTLERFFEDWVPRSSSLYLLASTEDLREVEKWGRAYRTATRRYYRQVCRCAVPTRG